MAGQMDALLILRDIAAGAETSDTAETGVNIANIKNMGAYQCNINVSAVAAAGADELYDFTVEVSDVVAGTYTVVGSGSYLRGWGPGMMIIPLNGQVIKQLDADADWMRINLNVTGASPSITYGAWLSPADHGHNPSMAQELF